MVTSVSSPQCTLLWKGNDTVVLTVYFVPEATQIENSFVLGYQPYNSDQQSANGRSLWRDYVIPPVTVSISCAYSGELVHNDAFNSFFNYRLLLIAVTVYGYNYLASRSQHFVERQYY